MDRQRHVLAGLFCLPHNSHHTLHPRLVARQALYLLHSFGLVGAILGMVLEHRSALSGYRNEHALHGKGQA